MQVRKPLSYFVHVAINVFGTEACMREHVKTPHIAATT